MCIGPSSAEKAAAAAQQQAAQEQKKREIEERSRQKREDITEAVEGRATSRGRSGSVGRRSLFTAPGGGGGFTGRFN